MSCDSEEDGVVWLPRRPAEKMLFAQPLFKAAQTRGEDAVRSAHL